MPIYHYVRQCNIYINFRFKISSEYWKSHHHHVTYSCHSLNYANRAAHILSIGSGNGHSLLKNVTNKFCLRGSTFKIIFKLAYINCKNWSFTLIFVCVHVKYCDKSHPRILPPCSFSPVLLFLLPCSTFSNFTALNFSAITMRENMKYFFVFTWLFSLT